MTEKSKGPNITSGPNRKKFLITEEDISSLLLRYTANTVLALLQEVAQFEGVKIDWNALVKKTTTGINNVREYQMLWRHLAYGHCLLDNFEDGARPLDDDSDLEYELEAFPDVSNEASAEAAACVKVLIASGAASDTAHRNGNTIEAPLTMNIPNGLSVKSALENSQPVTMGGMNITVPVSVQKQSLPTVASVEGLDANSLGNGSNIPPRRKRKPWSEAEDLELIAAVHKYGEGNWTNILRSEFNWERTASQLSQRWKNIQKRHKNDPVGNTGEVQLSEAQQAARHAMNLALDLPVKSTFMNNSAEDTSTQHHSGRPFVLKSSSMVSLGSAPKSQIIEKKPAKPDLSSDPVRAAAVAAGARIATQSDAASLLKAAQAKNTVHIMPTGCSSLKSTLPGGTSTLPVVSPGSTRPATASAGQYAMLNSGPAKDISRQSNAELSSKKDTAIEQMLVLSDDVEERQAKKHGVCITGNETSKQIQGGKVALANQEAESKIQNAIASCSNSLSKSHMAECNMVDVLAKQVGGSQVEGSQTSNGGKMTCSLAKKELNTCKKQVNGDDQTIIGKPAQTDDHGN